MLGGGGGGGGGGMVMDLCMLFNNSKYVDPHHYTYAHIVHYVSSIVPCEVEMVSCDHLVWFVRDKPGTGVRSLS